MSALSRRCSRAGLLFLLIFGALAAVPRAVNAGGSTFDMSVDPRLELLGIIQRLAGYGRPSGTDDPYARDVDAAFGRFKDHPAVKLYADAYRRKGGHEGFGIILMYYTQPPELKLADKSVSPPYLETEEDQAVMQRFLWELRDFSAVSGFPKFVEDHRKFYESVVAAARKEQGDANPVARVESYLGISLESRCHYYLDLLYRNDYSSSFIEPYPDPESLVHRVTSPFEVYNLAHYDVDTRRTEGFHTDLGAASGFLWQEMLFVFIDPSFYYFEAANVPDPKAFYGTEVFKCRSNPINCAKSYLVAALVDRLNKVASVPGNRGSPLGQGFRTDYVEAFSRRLDEYERHRDKYPTLWSFYPRLFTLFHQVAFPGSPEVDLRLPDAGPLRKATDFFEPNFRERGLKVAP